MATFGEAWQRFNGANLHDDRELFEGIAAICSHALSSHENIPSGVCQGATLKLGRELRVHSNWDVASTPEDKSFNAYRQWTLTWFMNALNPKPGMDMSPTYSLCVENARLLLTKLNR